MTSPLLVAALAFVVADAAHAQTVVAGRVVDRVKRVALEKVAVELLGPRDTVLTARMSAADGAFALMAPRGGTYRVRLMAPGASPRVSDSLTVAEGEYLTREFPIEVVPRSFAVPHTFLAFQVDKPVAPVAGSPTPPYPEDLRARRVSGCVLIDFVVDTTGRVDMSTLELLAYNEREFVAAVHAALPRMTFVPAELDGKKVRQLVRHPFTFTIEGDQTWECKPGVKVR